MSGPVDVAVLGASGLVGERLVNSLTGHPTFRVAEVCASAASTGRRLGDTVRTDSEPAALRLLAPGAPLRSPIVLSALPRAAALELEPLYASRGHLVCSNASAYRDDARVPLVVPEVNPGALQILRSQEWPGALVTNPNCVVSGLALALAPLQKAFGIEALTVVTLQALSGAGRRGLDAWQTTGNVIPHIEGEAEKVPGEICKVLDADFPVSIRVNRVPVLDGHLASVFVRLGGNPALPEIRDTLERFTPPVPCHALPSAPACALELLDLPDRPQPRLDLDRGSGMTVVIGGLQTDPVHDASFTVLSHNLVRGAAGACLLNAELAWQYLQGEGTACRAAGLDPAGSLRSD